jgi:hypothetical protein
MAAIITAAHVTTTGEPGRLLGKIRIIASPSDIGRSAQGLDATPLEDVRVEIYSQRPTRRTIR